MSLWFDADSEDLVLPSGDTGNAIPTKSTSPARAWLASEESRIRQAVPGLLRDPSGRVRAVARLLARALATLDRDRELLNGWMEHWYTKCRRLEATATPAGPPTKPLDIPSVHGIISEGVDTKHVRKQRSSILREFYEALSDENLALARRILEANPDIRSYIPDVIQRTILTQRPTKEE